MEELDQASGTEAADVSIALGGKQKDFQVEHMPEMLDGVTVLRHPAAIAEVPSAEQALYGPANPAAMRTRPGELTLIPYYAWANRKPTPMQVWIPVRS